jgi:hypothetical protein
VRSFFTPAALERRGCAEVLAFGVTSKESKSGQDFRNRSSDFSPTDPRIGLDVPEPMRMMANSRPTVGTQEVVLDVEQRMNRVPLNPTPESRAHIFCDAIFHARLNVNPDHKGPSA